MLLLLLAIAAAQPTPTTPELLPGTRYDPAIPTLEQVVGHDFGSEITASTDILAYLAALADAAPDRCRLIAYGTTWEDRPLQALLIGSPDRLERLDAIQGDLRRLADPRGLAPEEMDRLVADLPVVSLFMHGVHGAEISPSGAAMAEAYHLLAALDDPAVDTILRESLIIIDPSLNPDGRTRLLLNNRLTRAARPDPHPLSAEHDEPWPGGRVNHYLFDLNRDWFAQTQRETRARVQLIRNWMPHVVVDLHEMGSGENTYYFPPPAPGDNPWLSAPQQDLFETFGLAIADRFDDRGFDYFTREDYRAGPHPGSGSSWPLTQGAIAMLFEEATPISLVHRREDGTLFTYRDGVIEHFTAALTTATVAAQNRERILRAFAEYRRSAVDEGAAGSVRAYVIPVGRDPGQARRMAAMLVRNDVEVERTSEPFSLGERELAAGSYVVPLSQPAGRAARNLLSSGTTWSLPALFDLEVLETDTTPTVPTTPYRLDTASGPSVDLPPARVAYLLPWNATTAATVTEALAAGMRIRAGTAPFTLAGREFPAGTAIVRVADHGADLPRQLGAIVARHGAEIFPTDTNVVESGMALGSNRVRTLAPPRVLLAWDAPTFKYSSGWTRYVLEQRYGQAVTIVRARTLPRIDLSEFDVVVLPSPHYDGVLGPDAVLRLRIWLERGGTLITLGDASRWAARAEVGLLDASVTLTRGTAEQYADAVSASLLRLVLDPSHWLSFGTDGEVQMLSSGRRAIAPVEGTGTRAVGRYPDTNLLLAGRLPELVAEQLAGAAALVHQRLERGHVVAFTEEPNAFGYAEATQLLFMNAVLFGPAHLAP